MFNELSILPFIMGLESIIHGIDWRKEGAKVDDITQKEAGGYKKLGWLLVIISLPAGIFFPFILLATIPLAAYMFYFYWKNVQERPFAYWVKINRKECWFKDGRPVNGSEDSESSDNSFYYYLLHVTSIAQWVIYPDKLIKTENEGKKRIIRLNSSLFQQFEAGEEVFFVYSPANDLIGYVKSHELILFGNKTINGKALSQTSIPQELVYPPEDGFELVSISTLEG